MDVEIKKLVAGEVFRGGMSEDEIIETYGVGRGELRSFLKSKAFKKEIGLLCRQAVRDTRFTLTRFAPLAAAKLVELMDSDKPDVVRRAALDLIGQVLEPKEDSSDDKSQGAVKADAMSDAEARGQLMVLAKGGVGRE